MQNQNLQQSFIDTKAQANNITHIYLAKNRHMINRSVDGLKNINSTTCNNNVTVYSLDYARNFLLILSEMDHR